MSDLFQVYSFKQTYYTSVFETGYFTMYLK